MDLADRLHRLGLRFGLEVRRLNRVNSPTARRLRLLGDLKIALVLDVGANTGQYGRALRSAGYRGEIVSFEPQSAALAKLRRAGDADPGWRIEPIGLAAAAGRAEIQIAGNSASSSLLEMHARHREAAPQTAPVGTESIELATLDALAGELIADGQATFLKLDVQGYELEVLKGAAQTLGKIAAIEVEMSLVELYRGAPSLPDLYSHLDAAGFECVAISPGFSDRRSGRMLQVDGLFARA